ncbi:FlaD/FlaE family flagellar protein [Halegenticoccus tardaugens]|uniref:FlaD/FlaE family flagellar protein n=1 Tax=Halegenticoccus tardaugens TaxID=2071624 RepID=UPI00100AB769|nr:FlaD/FlaE family flagellar protein [Halegenticoccus tardaugens]
MTLNPSDYDLAERRTPAGDRPSEPDPSWERRTRDETGAEAQRDGRRRGRERRRGSAPDREAIRGNRLQRLFFLQSAMGDGAPSRPFLSSLPERRIVERVVFDWLEFLALNAGTDRAREALAYYREIDWISAEVESDLRGYLADFPADDSSVAHSTLDSDDHRRSLLYVARIAASARSEWDS